MAVLNQLQPEKGKLNINLTNARSVLKLNGKTDLSGNWYIPDLLSALYLDVYLKQANITMLKKWEIILAINILK